MTHNTPAALLGTTGRALTRAAKISDANKALHKAPLYVPQCQGCIFSFRILLGVSIELLYQWILQ